MTNQILFTAYCPAFKKEISLFRHTWYGHIMSRHWEMRNKRSLIKRAIEETLEINLVMRFLHYPKSKWFFNYQCVDFLPLNNFLRVSLEILNSGVITVTSAYPVDSIPKTGIVRYDL